MNTELDQIKALAYRWALTPYDSCEDSIDLGYSNTTRHCGEQILAILGEKIPEPCCDESYCENKELHERKDCILPPIEE